MDINDHTSPAQLERYAFKWLMLLLVFSAAALFLGGRPLILMFTGHSSSAAYSLLDLSWVICGVAAGYLTYLWTQNNKQVFGGDNTKDKVAFWFMLLTGYNLGITGLLGNNFYFDIFMGRAAFIVTGIACAVVAVYLWNRWQQNGEKLFGHGESKAKEGEVHSHDDHGHNHDHNHEHHDHEHHHG